MQMKVAVDIYPPEGSEIRVRQVALGLQPVILIESTEEDGGETIVLNVHASQFVDDIGDLADMIETFAQAIREVADGSLSS